MQNELRTLRQMSGMSQFELARRSGVDRSKLSLVENGHVELRPEEANVVRKVLLERIESRAAQFKSALSGSESVAV